MHSSCLCLFSLNFICQLWRLTFKESSSSIRKKLNTFHLLTCFFCELVSQLLCCRQFPIKVLKVHSFGNVWLVVGSVENKAQTVWKGLKLFIMLGREGPCTSLHGAKRDGNVSGMPVKGARPPPVVLASASRFWFPW